MNADKAQNDKNEKYSITRNVPFLFTASLNDNNDDS